MISAGRGKIRAAEVDLLARRSVLGQISPTPTLDVSTVPANGDVNPYGVAVIPRGFLVSNFNNSKNLQGTGTTIVQITRDGRSSVFYQGPQGEGLTTALGVLRRGFVIVGNVPTTDGTSATVQPGSLIVLNRFGQKVAEWQSSQLLNGPWDLAIRDLGDRAQIFVSNVLSGTVTRIDVVIGRGRVVPVGIRQIASGYVARPDPTALVVGPTGLAYDARRDLLYVASTGDNAIYAIPNASRTTSDSGKGVLVYRDDAHLHGPLGLVLAPNGNLITANGDAVNPADNQPSELVEFTPQGQFVDQFSISDMPGAAFGLALPSNRSGFVLAAVNDVTNTLQTWRVLR